MFTLRTLALSGILALAACGATDTGNMSPEDQALLNAQFDSPQVCTAGQPDPRACDPANTKKTTICHLPPGNPANAHTLCVGNPAVPAHLAHGDHLGSCCDATGGGGTGGIGGGGNGGPGGGPGGNPGDSPDGGAGHECDGGAGGTGGSGGGGGTGGTGGSGGGGGIGTPQGPGGSTGGNPIG